ncbi:DUF6332 family protein [Streptomyces sp. NPDC002785]|uniref:DUF6332 family protein n=1 Tax=Streptomyces sp. NPDC002785 TaxID=3154543 RepID=UPI00331659E4
MGRRSQEDRDAVTVEIGFAVVSGALLAAAAFTASYVPALLLGLPGAARSGLAGIAAVVAALVFVGRVVDVLWRFGRRNTAVPVVRRPPSCPGGQPSQPGRTSPDS